MRELEPRIGPEMETLELRLTTRLGAMVAASAATVVAILGALITFN